MTKKHLNQLADTIADMHIISNEINATNAGCINQYCAGYESAVRDFEMKLKSFAHANCKNFNAAKWDTYIAKAVAND